jgi:hypothetical protein
VFILSGRLRLELVNSIFTVNSEKYISYESNLRVRIFFLCQDLKMVERAESFLSAQDVWLGYFHSNDNPLIWSAACFSKFELFSVCLWRLQSYAIFASSNVCVCVRARARARVHVVLVLRPFIYMYICVYISLDVYVYPYIPYLSICNIHTSFDTILHRCVTSKRTSILYRLGVLQRSENMVVCTSLFF